MSAPAGPSNRCWTCRKATTSCTSATGSRSSRACAGSSATGEVKSTCGCLDNIEFVKIGDYLQIILPSGRVLYYFRPSVTGNVEIENRQDQVRYWGTNSFNHQWEYIEMYGGKWAQNICEGICRDLLGRAMHELTADGFHMVLSVHDENICDDPPGQLDRFRSTMSSRPAWASIGGGLPVAVDAFEAARYRK